MTPRQLAGALLDAGIADATAEQDGTVTGTVGHGYTFAVTEDDGLVRGGVDTPLREPLTVGIFDPEVAGNEPADLTSGLPAADVADLLADYL